MPIHDKSAFRRFGSGDGLQAECAASHDEGGEGLIKRAGQIGCISVSVGSMLDSIFGTSSPPLPSVVDRGMIALVRTERHTSRLLRLSLANQDEGSARPWNRWEPERLLICEQWGVTLSHRFVHALVVRLLHWATGGWPANFDILCKSCSMFGVVPDETRCSFGNWMAILPLSLYFFLRFGRDGTTRNSDLLAIGFIRSSPCYSLGKPLSRQVCSLSVFERK